MATLVVAACGGSRASSRRDTLRAPSLEGREVGGVAILGNETFSDAEIVRGLALRPPRGAFSWMHIHRRIGPYSTYESTALLVDQERIEAFYRARGYFSAHVTATKAVRTGDRVGIAFVVAEGKPTRITHVTTEGVPPEAQVDLASVAAEQGVAPGKRLVHERYTSAKREVERVLQRAGYAHTQVNGEIRVHRENRTAEVHFRIDSGPKVKFGAIHVEGNDGMPTEAIENRVEMSPGDDFDPDKLDRTAERVRELGTFSSVRTDYDTVGRPAVSDAYVRVNERTRHEIKLGGGGGLDGALATARARFDYTNWMSIHPLVTLRSSLRPGVVVYNPDELDVEGDFVVLEAEASLTRQDLVFPLLSGSIIAEVDRDVFEAYSSTGAGGGLRLDRPLFARALTLSAGWQLSTLFQIQPTEGVVLGADAPYRLGYFTQSIALDLRDSPVRTRSGAFAQVTAEQGHRVLGSQIDYLRATGELRGYLPLGRIVVGARVRGGLLDVRSEGDEPFTRRFYSGGASSHRGFDFRRLSPGPVQPIGGDALFETTLEVRTLLTRLSDLPLSWAIFTDGGDVTGSPSELSLARLHWAVGTGLRIDTPVGPIRFDVGVRLNRLDPAEPDGTPNPSPGDRLSVHLSVGEAF